MNTIKKMPLICLTILMSCGLSKNNVNSSALKEINYMKNHPSKELKLQDIADVKYIPLQTTNGKPFHGRINYCDNDLIIGFAKSSKDVVIYSGEGKEAFRVNHLGNGPKEYTKGSMLTYNPQAKEILIYSVSNRRINAYSLTGEFKRSFYSHNKMLYTSIIPYHNNLIAYDRHVNEDNIVYLKTSAKDGELLGLIDTRFTKKREIDLVIDRGEKGSMSYSWYDSNTKIYCGENLLLNDFSSDTIYSYTPAGEVIPHTAITPSLGKNREPWIVMVNGESKSCCFYTAFKKKLPPKGERFITRILSTLIKSTGLNTTIFYWANTK